VGAVQPEPEPQAQRQQVVQQQEPRQPAPELPARAEGLATAWVEAQPPPAPGQPADAPQPRRAVRQRGLRGQSHPEADGPPRGLQAAWRLWQAQTTAEPRQSAVPDAAEARSGEARAVASQADAVLVPQMLALPGRAKTGWLAVRVYWPQGWPGMVRQAGKRPARSNWVPQG
jgi:hypothetical protein